MKQLVPLLTVLLSLLRGDFPQTDINLTVLVIPQFEIMPQVLEWDLKVSAVFPQLFSMWQKCHVQCKNPQ